MPKNLKTIEYKRVLADKDQLDNPCESCYFEDMCMQTEHMPYDISNVDCETSFWERL